jgi:hypothetical protein
LGTTVAYLPMALYFLQHPLLFAARARSVHIFNPINATHLESVYDTSAPIPVLWQQLQRIALFLVKGGDSSWQYGFQGRFINAALALPAVVGLAVAVMRHRTSSLLILLWIGGVLVLGGLITVDPPFTPRLSVFSTLILFFPALGICFIAERAAGLSRRAEQYIFWSIALLTVYASACVDTYAYFVDYAGQFGIERREYIVRILDEHKDISALINATSRPETFGHEAYSFVRPNLKAVDLPDPAALDVALASAPKPLLLITPYEPNSTTAHIPVNRVTLQGEVNVRNSEEAFRWYVIR